MQSKQEEKLICVIFRIYSKYCFGVCFCVQTHLSIIQNVMQRMAINSSPCKTWCVTILVMIVDKSIVEYIYLDLFPIIVFACLDAIIWR